MVSHSASSPPLSVAWQTACQPSSTSGGLHLLFPRFVVSMEERNAPPSRAHPLLLRPHSFRKICRELRLRHFFRLHVFITSPIFYCCMVANCNKLPEPVRHSESTFFLRALYNHLDWAVAVESALIKLSQTPCGAACARKTLGSRRFMLSGMTKNLLGALQSYWPPHAAHHQLV